MKLLIKHLNLIFFVFAFFYLVGCNDDPTNSKTGILHILAIDNGEEETPIPNLEITITPGDFVKNTDENGVCLFELDPGDYFLNTKVCCAGASYWHPYEEPVTIIESDTVEVILPFCLSCE
mgnify:CR=1 FL=1|tara:strand:+ start:1079 stop:1441 length:363 start_codon:yes stop_codon:yes gene_type:complete